MRRLVAALIGAALLGAGVFFGLTSPVAMPVPPVTDANLPEGDAAAGKLVFAAGGCTSCHAAPESEGEAKLVLAGGLALNTEFGTFVVPNISPDPAAGIGAWSATDFVNAMRAGVSPDGRHYYPAFPFTSYARMTDRDLADLWAYMQTLPASDVASQPHQLGFPFNMRRGLGLWKQLNHRGGFVTPEPTDAAIARGRYLVEGPGHCSECHTPRDVTGGIDTARWMQGAPNPDGKGRIPDITNTASGIGDWAEGDIVYYLESGFTPDFDSAGGQMAEVIGNTSQLPASDREAIAAYLKGLDPN